jgi:hypothetical protein
MKISTSDINPPNRDKYLEGMNEIYDFPTTILQEFFQHEYLFIMGMIPSHNEKDDMPNMSLDVKTGNIPIDGFLGIYDPSKRHITIYNRCIEEASLLLRRTARPLYTTDPDELQKCLWYIVKYHMYSHAMVHLSVKTEEYNRIVAHLSSLELDRYRTEKLRTGTELYQSIDTRLHEHIASLLTYYILKKRHSKTAIKDWYKKSITIFEELNKRQIPEYNIDDYLNVSYLKFQESKIRFTSAFGLMKDRMLAPTFDAWDSIMRM